MSVTEVNVMKFYHFSQNNSGGGFHFEPDRGISAHVIIEAKDENEAVDRAERIGLYFDGVEDDLDCECCGDRWDRPWSGDLVPTAYYPVDLDNPDATPTSDLMIKWIDGPEGFIHYADGRMVPFWSEIPKD